MASLWKKGNGMKDKFILGPAMRALKHDFGAPTVKDLLTSQQSQWDYVIINDHTQWPARENSREETLVVLKEHYVPLLKQCQAVPIFIMTAGYRVPNIRGTDDLGDFDHYTQLLKEGCAVYKEKMDSWLLLPNGKQTRIAPVGLAYALVYHSDRDLWYRLYDGDNFHPSPLGTLLQAFVLYITMTGEAPPSDYQENWWDRARRMQPPEENPLPLPSNKEASTLRRIAMEICYQVGLTTTVTLPSNEEAEKMRQVAMQVCGIHEQ
jgi:hypothetical protein